MGNKLLDAKRGTLKMEKKNYTVENDWNWPKVHN